MENSVFKVVLVVTFILKIPTGTIVCCFRPLNSGVKKSPRRVGGSQLGNTAERNSLLLESEVVQRL